MILVYAETLVRLAADWFSGTGTSFCLAVVVLAVYAVYRRQWTLVEMPARPSMSGVAVVAASCVAFVVARLAAEVFVARISFFATCAGLAWAFGGWKHLRRVFAPLVFLATAVPLPAIIYNQLSAPLEHAIGSAATQIVVMLGSTLYVGSTNVAGAATFAPASGMFAVLKALPSAIATIAVAKAPGWREWALWTVIAFPALLGVLVLRIVVFGWLADSHAAAADAFYKGTPTIVIYLVAIMLAGAVFFAATRFRKRLA